MTYAIKAIDERGLILVSMQKLSNLTIDVLLCMYKYMRVVKVAK